MTRVKRGTHAIKRRRKLLSKTKGYRNARSTKERQAKEAWVHAARHAFNHRKQKKGVFRRLWQTKINAAVREHGMSYSQFIDALKKKNIGLDRKVLATLAENNPETFERIVKKIS